MPLSRPLVPASSDSHRISLALAVRRFQHPSNKVKKNQSVLNIFKNKNTIISWISQPSQLKEISLAFDWKPGS